MLNGRHTIGLYCRLASVLVASVAAPLDVHVTGSELVSALRLGIPVIALDSGVYHVRNRAAV